MSEDDKKLVAKAIEIVQQELDVTTGRWISTADMLPAEGQMCVIANLASNNRMEYRLARWEDERFTTAGLARVPVSSVDWWYAVPERSEGC